MTQVILWMPLHFTKIAKPILAKGLPAYHIISLNGNESKEYILNSLRRAHYLVYTGVSINDEIMSSAPELKLIQKWGSGIDEIDVQSAQRRGVYVANVAGGNAIAVSEHFFALLFAIYKRICISTTGLQKGIWMQSELIVLGIEEVRGKSLGIVGLGQVGSAIASRALAFEMEVLYYKPNRLSIEEEISKKVRYRNFLELISESDIICLSLPLTDSTKYLINAAVFEKMKQNAILINISRGPIIDEVSLYRALTEGRIAGAGLDVFEKEPLSEKSPLIGLNNVVLTPHIAGRTIKSLRYITEQCLQNILLVSQGKKPNHLLEHDNQ